MATTYTVEADGHTETITRARKEAAIAAGEKLGVPFIVRSSSGKIVHEHVITVEAEETPEPEQAPEAEPVDNEPKAGSKQFDVSAMKRKISSLLQKAERTDNEAERDAFNAKAEQLMLRLGLNQAELEAAGEKKAETIIEERLHWESVYAKDMVHLAGLICSGLGNLTTLQSGRWARASVYIIGHKSDVELAVKLIRSLELQVTSALAVWQKANREERKGLNNYDKLVGNRSFMKGFGLTVSNRLATERTQVESEASTGAALVLASKMDRVTAKVEEMYPKLGKARGGNARYSSLAMADGRKAGQTADIGHKRVGGKKGELQ